MSETRAVELVAGAGGPGASSPSAQGLPRSNVCSAPSASKKSVRVRGHSSVFRQPCGSSFPRFGRKNQATRNANLGLRVQLIQSLKVVNPKRITSGGDRK